MTDKQAPEPISYHLKAVPALTGVPLRTLYYAIADGQLTVKKSGRRNIIEATEVRRFIASLPTRGRQPDSAAA